MIAEIWDIAPITKEKRFMISKNQPFKQSAAYRAAKQLHTDLKNFENPFFYACKVEAVDKSKIVLTSYDRKYLDNAMECLKETRRKMGESENTKKSEEHFY